MKDFVVALDWTPNTNHAGMFVAAAKGLYSAAGLNVTFVSPHADEYKRTPASRVTAGEADIAITPSETVVSFYTAPKDQPRPRIRAVAALLQEDVSAIATLKASGIDRPAKLEGKRYASYAARYEGRIVQRMIQADGGSGEYTELVPPMLGIYNTLLKGEAEATWIFSGWEGVEAKLKGVELNEFRLKDFGIKYGYSPVMVALESRVAAGGEGAASLGAFLKATEEGYRRAVEDKGAAVEAVLEQAAKVGFPLDRALVAASLDYTAPYFVSKTTGKFGTMDESRWGEFLDWLSEAGLLTTKIQSRGAPSDTTATLDGLRAGDVGDRIPRDSVPAADLFTNSFL